MQTLGFATELLMIPKFKILFIVSLELVLCLGFFVGFLNFFLN